MAGLVSYSCKDCKESFSAIIGPKMRSMLLRCSDCGDTKHLGYDDLEEAKVDWRDEAAVEKFAGQCSCGGRFQIDAPVRCPKCKSANLKLKKNGPRMFID